MKRTFLAGILLLSGCVGDPPVGELTLGVATVAQTSIYKTGFEVSTGRPVVEMMVNDAGPYKFIFDTGAPGLILLQPLARDLKVPVTGTKKVGSPAGGTPVDAEIATIQSVTLGGATVKNIEATILDMGQSPSNADGVIGPAVFQQYGRVSMDFDQNILEIGGAFTSPDQTAWIPFGESAPILDAELMINGIGIPAHIDTGAPQTIAIPELYADQLPLTGPVRVIARARTIDREFEIKGAPIDVTARVGDATIPLRQLQFFDLPFANIGTGALRGLYLEIDWGRERFALSGSASPVELQPRRVRVMSPTEE